MLSHRILSHTAIHQLTGNIDKDQHLLFYSYLTQRKDNALFIGQFFDGHLIAVLAYFSGLSFPAFSFYRINKDEIFLPQLIAFARESLKLGKNAICGTILNPPDLKLFNSHGLITGTPKRFLTMKHLDQTKIAVSPLAELITEDEYSEVIAFLRKGGMKFFTRSELERLPFLGIKENGEFTAVGGFHFYDTQLAELGNIVTREDYRGKGLAKLLVSQLTQLGKRISPEVYLGVFAENLPAVHVYKSLGYQTVAELSIVDFTLSCKTELFHTKA